MRYLLDTDVLIAWRVRGDDRVAGKLAMHWPAIGLSAIVMHELFFGAHHGVRIAENLVQIDEIDLPVVEFSLDDARRAGEIRAALRRAGTPIGPYDVLIAGQALARDLVLVTNNVRKFARVDGLRLEDWTLG